MPVRSKPDETGPVTLSPVITSAVAQSDLMVLGEAPALEMGNLYQIVGNSWSMLAGNAVFAQQQADVSYQASSSVGVTKLLSIPVSG